MKVCFFQLLSFHSRFQKKNVQSNLYSYINNKEMKKEVAFLPLNVCCKCVGRGEWESVAAC